MDRVPEHLKATIARIRAATVSSPPDPWTYTGTFHVGGLTSVGFGRSSDLLLVVSQSGRGVFDCASGERLARDSSDYMENGELEAEGIGPLAGEMVRIAGLYGGGLPRGSGDQWFVYPMELDWPDCTILLVPPGSDLYGEVYGRPASFVKIFEEPEIRAFGFSSTGKTLVTATSGDVRVYHRNACLQV